jgi:hypothetical protein
VKILHWRRVKWQRHKLKETERMKLRREDGGGWNKDKNLSDGRQQPEKSLGLSQPHTQNKLVF